MTHIFNTAPWSWVGQPPQRRGRRARAGNYRRPLAIRDAVIAGAFGREVRRLRTARGMTGRRLAELVALSAPNISQIEHDRRQQVTLRHIWDFAEALNVTPEHFVVVIRKAVDRFEARMARSRSDLTTERLPASSDRLRRSPSFGTEQQGMTLDSQS
jgi:transcriptional regulator with XRE-family HTH domain